MTLIWQVILLNEQIESRTIKLGIHLPEPCVDMVIISSSSEQSKHKQDSLLLLGKSGGMYAYDDYAIEKYLLQCQSRSSPSLPKEIMVNLPFSDSSITTAKFITDNPNFLNTPDQVTLSCKSYWHWIKCFTAWGIWLSKIDWCYVLYSLSGHAGLCFSCKNHSTIPSIWSKTKRWNVVKLYQLWQIYKN